MCSWVRHFIHTAQQLNILRYHILWTCPFMYFGGRLDSLGMSLKWKVLVVVQSDQSEASHFLSIRRRCQMWLEQPTHDYKQPTTAFACGEFCQLLTKGWRFPPGTLVFSVVKLTAMIWPQMLNVALKTNQSIPFTYSVFVPYRTAIFTELYPRVVG